VPLIWQTIGCIERLETPMKQLDPMDASAANAAKSAIEILNDDHRRIIELFSLFENMRNDIDDRRKQRIVETTCLELALHQQIEEEIFYPALRRAFPQHRMLDEASVEHDTAERLIQQLSAMGEDDAQRDATFTVLGHYVRYHIEAEANELFSKARRASIDLETLGMKLVQRKHTLRMRHLRLLGSPGSSEFVTPFGQVAVMQQAG